MIRTLLTTTALTAMLSTAAIAQEQAQPASPEITSVQPPAVNSGIGATPQAFNLAQGYTPVDSDNLASRVLGSEVYSSSGDNAEVIGDVNDFVLDANGNITAVVLGVGGFLGVGEKNVAVPFSELQWTTASDGSTRIVFTTTKDAIATAPDFVWPADAGAPTPAMSGGGGGGNAMADNPSGASSTPPDRTADQSQQAAPGSPDPSQMRPLDEATLTADDIKGIAVFGQNDEQIGTIGDLVVNADGKIDAIIVDVGGFLGVGSKPVAVGFDNLQFSVDADNQRYLFLNATKDQLEKQPQFDKATYPQQRDAQRMVVSPNG